MPSACPPVRFHRSNNGAEGQIVDQVSSHRRLHHPDPIVKFTKDQDSSHKLPECASKQNARATYQVARCHIIGPIGHFDVDRFNAGQLASPLFISDCISAGHMLQFIIPSPPPLRPAGGPHSHPAKSEKYGRSRVVRCYQPRAIQQVDEPLQPLV